MIGSGFKANSRWSTVHKIFFAQRHALPILESARAKKVQPVHWTRNGQLVVETGPASLAKRAFRPIRRLPNSQILIGVINGWILPRFDREQNTAGPGFARGTMAGMVGLGFFRNGELDSGTGATSFQRHDQLRGSVFVFIKSERSGKIMMPRSLLFDSKRDDEERRLET